ncbi:hypothetical protein ACFV2V_19020 [Streptomyces sp. NPDC059698]|uniref:hypothetical protein n=1 Tax=Streptomyces TaxID=1883 RepID=UPI001300E214|nr:hypothetical protein [Streptomyces sp. CB02366]
MSSLVLLVAVLLVLAVLVVALLVDLVRCYQEAAIPMLVGLGGMAAVGMVIVPIVFR